MENFDKYTNDILDQILDSYSIIDNLKDKPGDLKILKKEWLKIIGLLRVLVKKTGSAENQSDRYQDLYNRSKYYIENYDFEREIDIMTPLYSEDTNRLANIRFKIMESFDDKKLIESLRNFRDIN